MRWMIDKFLRFGGEKPAKAGKRAPPKRRRAAPRWLAPAMRIIAVVAIFAVALGGPTWLWRSGWIAGAWQDARNSAVTASASIGLTVQEVLLEGRVNAPKDRVLKAIGLKIGDPIMGFDPEMIRRRLEAVPWINKATVERRLPGVIRVKVVERLPMALWQRNGRLALVGRDGVPITSRKLGRFRDLLVIVGSDAPRHAPDLLSLLAAQPTIGKRVRSAVRVGARRWNLKLDNGIDIRLPETGAADALAQLVRFERRHGLLSGDIDAIDLRMPDRMIVRPRSGRTRSTRNQEKRT